ncbi:MAG TPA: hypothetical protein VGG95_14095 [Edaphobacter sp.]
MKATPVASPNVMKVTLWAGLLVGTLDIADALIFYGIRGVPATRILQGIAFGLIGNSAFTLGTLSAVVGLVLHYFIATTVAAVYMLVSLSLPLWRLPWLFGTLYGIAVYTVMNYMVLPLSHVGVRPIPAWIPLLNGIAALIFLVGIPLALIARRYLSPRRS